MFLGRVVEVGNDGWAERPMNGCQCVQHIRVASSHRGMGSTVPCSEGLKSIASLSIRDLKRSAVG